MSAPGVQLNSAPHLTYFQPTIQQYLQSVKEAVMSNDLPAARQAFTQLTKAVPLPSRGAQASEVATRISQGLQAVGNALEAGDLSAAGQAVGELRQNLQSAPNSPADQQQSAVAESPSRDASDVSPSDNSSPEGPNLSVRV